MSAFCGSAIGFPRIYDRREVRMNRREKTSPADEAAHPYVSISVNCRVAIGALPSPTPIPPSNRVVYRSPIVPAIF